MKNNIIFTITASIIMLTLFISCEVEMSPWNYNECDNLQNVNFSCTTQCIAVTERTKEKYECGTLLFDFPIKDEIEQCEKDELVKNYFIELESFWGRCTDVKFNKSASSGTFEKCLCDYDIYIYHSDQQGWDIENAVSEAVNEGPDINGGIPDINLNYVFEIDGFVPPSVQDWVISHPSCIFQDTSRSPIYDDMKDGYIEPRNLSFSKSINRPQINSVSIDTPYHITPVEEIIDLNHKSCTKVLEPINDPILKKTIAILDTGLDLLLMKDQTVYYEPFDTHPCLIESDPTGWNFVNKNNDIRDDQGHGSIVALSYLNGLDVLGFDAGRQRILPVKVMDECGKGTLFNIICGLYYAKDKGADVINMSIGTYLESSTIFEEALDALRLDNIKVICSAGNDSLDMSNLNKDHYPSQYTNLNPSTQNRYDFVYEVGATCTNPLLIGCLNNLNTVPLWKGSNYRDKMFVEGGIHQEFLLKDFINLPLPNNESINGTSFAAPTFAASIIAELVNGTGTNLESQNYFLNKCVTVATPDCRSYFKTTTSCIY